MIKDSNVLSVHRLPEHEEIYPEIKDPSIVRLSNGRYMMFASVGRSSDQQWIVGRFTAPHPMGPWQEISPAEIIGVSGPQMCAPAVIYDDQESGKEKWTMYIQTACFIENGVIAEAHSEDGKTFTSVSASLIAKEHIQAKSQDIVGVYDPGVSQVTVEGEEMEALVFSGYRTIGSGDLYLSFKKNMTHCGVPLH